MSEKSELSSTINTRLEWVGRNCRLLKRTAEEFSRTLPFKGLTIGTTIHLEPKTAELLLTLKAGGAKVISTGNLNSTQLTTINYLQMQGIEVLAEPTKDPNRHAKYLDEIFNRHPDIFLDNGGDFFARYAEHPYPELRGGTEETTSGRMRLLPLRERIQKPVLVINDSPIKQFAENRHAVGQSVFESFMRFTNRSTNGSRVTVFGYGSCGKGIAACFRNAFSVVTVVDTNPVTTLEAFMDGFMTPTREIAITNADIIITVTGVKDVLTAADMKILKNGVIMANAGHFPWEIDVAGIESSGEVEETVIYEDEITTWKLKDGRKVHLLGRGHMVNLAGPRPLGNTIESMDLGFTLQSRCLEAVALGKVGSESCVVPVPPSIDSLVATTFMEMSRGLK
jgi:adenosylhomocysteinase